MSINQGLKCAGSHRVTDPAHFDLLGLYRVSWSEKIMGGIILLRTSCLKMLAKMRPDRVKMYQNAFGAGLRPDPLGELTAIPQVP